MKFWINGKQLAKCFSLHQSGTVMKLVIKFNANYPSFSLHQSGTVMK